MNRDVIICIGREYGSGGHEIGKRLAEKLDIPFYDKELIERTAKDGGINKELVKAIEEHKTASYLGSIIMSAYSYINRKESMGNISMAEWLFLVQKDVLRKIASEGSCVIVGRCAGYILKDDFNCLRVFICGEMEKKIKYLMKIGAVHDAKKAKELIMKVDNDRASYHNYYSSFSCYYTNQKWGSKEANDIILNSSRLGIDGCVELISQMVVLEEKYFWDEVAQE